MVLGLELKRDCVSDCGGEAGRTVGQSPIPADNDIDGFLSRDRGSRCSEGDDGGETHSEKKS